MPTRLKTLHPYPAMIADSLAEQIAERFVSSGMKVLDPFCGTGRTLFAAADRGAYCTGIDVNPLAVLLSKTKSKSYKLSEILRLLYDVENINPSNNNIKFDLERNRKVVWFSEESKKDLSNLILLINSRKRSESIKLIAASVLSATVREVSYCRNDRWKLHRISYDKRINHKPSAINVFTRRLKTFAEEIQKSSIHTSNLCFLLGDSRNLISILESKKICEPFDLIITSPPYGDSQTTVQYGGMSSICLGVISYIDGLNYLYSQGKEIDSNCLGGRNSLNKEFIDSIHDRYFQYWRGSKNNKGLYCVYQFLQDLEIVCNQINKILCKGGYAIFVVARRRVGTWRLYLDKFIEDVFNNLSMVTEQKECRKIAKKLLPLRINRHAGSNNNKIFNNGKVPTMSEEFILTFRKQ